MRKPSETDFKVVVEGVGEFRYAQRTIGDFIAIRKRYLEIAGETEDPYVLTLASVTAVHENMCVSCPEGWEDLTKLPFDREGKVVSQLLSLDRKIGEAEDSFRKGQDTAVEKAGD